ncbi:hypothetical protein M2262_001142 [Pseudomonas sp. BIGb0408]|uniref:Uncharacterized protein n=1 Tax=Phytopseudomonas flavescens TaxID=29435 RepID=A0A7Y9XN17_9GAMM|nr:hypothetical protein [Pseudomonas sp. BIGb0408]NYH74337.1 hypothetical protein [Pseudomonas flavescens]
MEFCVLTKMMMEIHIFLSIGILAKSISTANKWFKSFASLTGIFQIPLGA